MGPLLLRVRVSIFFFAHRMALGVQPRLKSWHVAWDPHAVRGAGRIEQAHFRHLYVTGTAAAFLERGLPKNAREECRRSGLSRQLMAGGAEFAWRTSLTARGA